MTPLLFDSKERCVFPGRKLAGNFPASVKGCCNFAADVPTSVKGCCIVAADVPGSRKVCCKFATDVPGSGEVCCKFDTGNFMSMKGCCCLMRFINRLMNLKGIAWCFATGLRLDRRNYIRHVDDPTVPAMTCRNIWTIIFLMRNSGSSRGYWKIIKILNYRYLFL